MFMQGFIISLNVVHHLINKNCQCSTFSYLLNPCTNRTICVSSGGCEASRLLIRGYYQHPRIVRQTKKPTRITSELWHLKIMFSVVFCLLGLDSTGTTSFRLSFRPRRMKKIIWFLNKMSASSYRSTKGG